MVAASRQLSPHVPGVVGLGVVVVVVVVVVLCVVVRLVVVVGHPANSVVVLTNDLMTGITGAGAEGTFALGVTLLFDPGQKLSLICLGVFTSDLGASVTGLAL